MRGSKGLGENGTGDLFFHLVRIITETQPKAFLLENVRGLTTMDEGRTLATVLARLRGAGYAVWWSMINASTGNGTTCSARIHLYTHARTHALDARIFKLYDLVCVCVCVCVCAIDCTHTVEYTAHAGTSVDQHVGLLPLVS